MKRYRFRWRLFRKVNGRWDETFRYRFRFTLSMLDMVWGRWAHGPGGKRWLYIILPGIVDANETNWR